MHQLRRSATLTYLLNTQFGGTEKERNLSLVGFFLGNKGSRKRLKPAFLSIPGRDTKKLLNFLVYTARDSVVFLIAES